MSIALADRYMGREGIPGGGREARRVEWRMRLERFRASGISIVAFCARENVSVASYYYWTRLLRDVVADQRNDRLSSAGTATSRGAHSDNRGTHSTGAAVRVRPESR